MVLRVQLDGVVHVIILGGAMWPRQNCLVCLPSMGVLRRISGSMRKADVLKRFETGGEFGILQEQAHISWVCDHVVVCGIADEIILSLRNRGSDQQNEVAIVSALT